MNQVYFDNAATTKLRPEVIAVMTTLLEQTYGNPSSIHGVGRAAKNKIEQARKQLAKLLGAQASEIIFTSGGTEADNLILTSAVRDLGVRHIVSTKIEHHAVLHTIEQLKRQFGITITYLKVSQTGTIDTEELSTVLQESEEKTLVSLMHINNEVGTILNLPLISTICKNNEAYLHSDMVQTIGHYAIDFNEIGLDFAAASAHKFHGPKGIGFAYIRRNSGLKPLLYGGEQERGLRAGTEAVHNIAGMECALRLALTNLLSEQQAIEALKSYFVTELQKNIPAVQFNGGSDKSSTNTYTLVNFSIPLPPEKRTILLFHLDINGVCCSQGSACQSGSTKNSHVLQEIVKEEHLEWPSLRFSFSINTTTVAIDYAIKVLTDFCK